MQSSLYNLRMEYWNQLYKNWVAKEFLTFPWFFIVAVLIILYIVWIKLVNRQRIREILLFGSFIAVAAAFIDLIGTTTGLWEYKIRLIPFSPAVFPFDYTLIPILYMLVLQYTSSWGGYLIGSLLVDALNSFVINPVYVMLGILQFHKFNYFYLFLLIFVVTTLIKAIYNWVTMIGRRSRGVY